jgi:putative copper export protein
MNIIIPSILTVILASVILSGIISRFSTYNIFILALIFFVFVLYNNVTMFGNEYVFFTDFYNTYGGKLLFILIMGGILFIVIGFISKINLVSGPKQKMFSSSRSFTNIPIEKILEIERPL